MRPNEFSASARRKRGAKRACPLLALALLFSCGSNKEQPTRSDDATVGGDAGSADSAGHARDASEGECSRHQDCVDQHEAHWICRSDHTCVSLLSDACTFVRGDDANDDAVFVGVLGVEGSPMFALSELVRRDFVDAVGGLPTRDSMKARRDNVKARSLVLVGCSLAFRADPLPGARHLVETIGVPAIVGPQGSAATLSVAQNVTVPHGVLLISPVALSDLLTDFADDDLVFRTNAATKALAPQLAAMVSDLERTVRAQRSITNLKVALVTSRDAYGLAISSALTPLLRFNGGLNAEANEARGRFFSISYDGTQEGFEREVAERVRAFAPHVVISLSGVEARPFKAIEEAFSDGSELPPYYVSDHAIGSFDHDLFVMSEPDSLRSRIRTTYPDPTRPLSQTFAARIRNEFGEAPSLLAGASVYDATYTVAFGIIAAGESALTGRAIARGIRRLTGPGNEIELVPQRIARGVELLQAGEKIDIVGTSGPLDFDARGDVLVDSAVGCYVRDATTGEVSLVFSGQVYRAATGKLEGTYSQCD
jgi:branched-chain amino acid transport system substrate-binding protein